MGEGLVSLWGRQGSVAKAETSATGIGDNPILCISEIFLQREALGTPSHQAPTILPKSPLFLGHSFGLFGCLDGGLLVS